MTEWYEVRARGEVRGVYLITSRDEDGRQARRRAYRMADRIDNQHGAVIATVVPCRRDA